MNTNQGSSQPPPLQPQKPSKYNFTCFMRPLGRLKAAMKALKEVKDSHKQHNIITSMELTTTNILFKAINGDRILALFTMLPNSYIFSFDLKDPITCAIDPSAFSHILDSRMGNANHILIYKIPGKNRLYCHFLDAKKEQKSDIVPMFTLNEAIKFNPKGLEPFCTVVINVAQWRHQVLKRLQLLEDAKIKKKEATFVVTRERVEIHTEKYKDDDEDNIFTYENKKDCKIVIQDGANQHEYSVHVEQIAVKPLISASKLEKVVVMRLYYGSKNFMTLSYEQDPRRSPLEAESTNRGIRGCIMFVYYPKIFQDGCLAR